MSRAWLRLWVLSAKIELSLKKRHRFSGVFFHSDIAEYLKNVIPILRLIGISYPKMGQDLDLKCFHLRLISFAGFVIQPK